MITSAFFKEPSALWLSKKYLVSGIFHTNQTIGPFYSPSKHPIWTTLLGSNLKRPLPKKTTFFNFQGKKIPTVPVSPKTSTVAWKGSTGKVNNLTGDCIFSNSNKEILNRIPLSNGQKPQTLIFKNIFWVLNVSKTWAWKNESNSWKFSNLGPTSKTVKDVIMYSFNLKSGLT